ncbi:deor family transcriptional regulator [Pediococcus cellicola]|uniref:Deor family transcriptional regulator n=1 Tax=Pediococcus cellicola TaxID=319652 RepID=A0A0R2IKI1_9LACO|nr:DeoR/GlpR family DNA-binding transcription regulator [Pediococcus cellicola]KRN65307.1 deor family transcriptional regulator [Pediococcus cellicola]GEL15784.1 DeoR family transcriptional regulator [Pediococcus cellicola]
MKVLTEERQNAILEQLKKSGIVKLQELVQLLDCSISTVRRDLQELEDQGKLVRIHGGAKAITTLQNEPGVLEKASKNVQGKQKIAKLAVDQIEADEVIYLDAGTSTQAMIPYMANLRSVLVVTNGVQLASQLADINIKTYLVGGELKNTTKAIVGADVVETIKNFRFNRAFMGVNGVHPKFGFTTPDPNEAAVKRAVLMQSEVGYFLADTSKLNEVSFAKVADLEAGILITDEQDSEVLQRFEQIGEIMEAEK